MARGEDDRVLGDSIDAYLGLARVAELRARGSHRIWLPNIGAGSLARAYAELGFDVLATDTDAAALTRQDAIAGRALHPTAARVFDPFRDPARPPLPLRVRRHDALAGAPAEAAFDLVWDRGLMLSRWGTLDLGALARAYVAAVPAGGHILVDVHGADPLGEHAAAIERALEVAGAWVAGREEWQAVRAAIVVEGIAARGVLGAVLAVDPADQARLTALLDTLDTAAARRPAPAPPPGAKIATIDYATAT